MVGRIFCFIFGIGFVLMSVSGCAANRQVDRRPPMEVLLDVVCGILEESEEERYDRLNREALKKRRDWQRENLTNRELLELGIRP